MSGSNKKSSKMSKLAKMNENERVKYMEKRLAEEQEVKKKKETLITGFLQLKIGHEAKLFTLNSPKLIEQWRRLLRTVKIEDLRRDIVALQDSFNKAIQKKSDHLKCLLQDFEDSESQYSMCFQTEISSILKLYQISLGRLSGMIKNQETNESHLMSTYFHMKNDSLANRERALAYLHDVLIALQQRASSKEQLLMKNHQALAEDIRNKNLEEKQSFQISAEEMMVSLWMEMKNQVSQSFINSEEKKRLYNELIARDKTGVAEVQSNNQIIVKLSETASKVKSSLSRASETQTSRLSGLTQEYETLKSRLFEARNNVSRRRDDVEQRKLSILACQIEAFDQILSSISKMHKESPHQIATVRTKALTLDPQFRRGEKLSTILRYQLHEKELKRTVSRNKIQRLKSILSEVIQEATRTPKHNF